jgi:hypothetical protein
MKVGGHTGVHQDRRRGRYLDQQIDGDRRKRKQPVRHAGKKIIHGDIHRATKVDMQPDRQIYSQTGRYTVQPDKEKYCTGLCEAGVVMLT